MATDYIWELGIDWNAIETAGVSYLRSGLVKDGSGALTAAALSKDDTITFRIFDVSSSVQARQVAGIESLTILTKAAVKDQPPIDPLSALQPTLGPADTAPGQITAFGNAFASWSAQPVAVTALAGRFLLTVQVQARGIDNQVRLFSHDPEMVVGASTSRCPPYGAVETGTSRTSSR